MRAAVASFGLCAALAFAGSGQTFARANTEANGQALIRAIQDADAFAATRLIGRDTDVNAHDEAGATPLMAAAQSGNLDLVKRLLAAGANPNLVNGERLGPLQIAIGIRAADIATVLLAHGADAKATRTDGETVLMTAARTGQLDTVKDLIARGADVNAHESRFDQTALMWSAGNPAAIKLLIEHGADVHARTKVWTITKTIYRSLVADQNVWSDDGTFTAKEGGETALHFCVRKDDATCVDLLLKAGASVDDASADGSTGLLLALVKWKADGWNDSRAIAPVFSPNADIANLLLDHGANVNVSNAEGYTPLHGAVLAFIPQRKAGLIFGYAPGVPPKPPLEPKLGLALVKRLLDLKSNPSAQTRHAMMGPTGVVRLSDDITAGSSPLHIAALSGNTELIQMLLDDGSDPNLIRPDGHSPLSVATKANNLQVVTLLVNRGADVKHIYSPTDAIIDPPADSSQDLSNISGRPRRNQNLLHIAAAARADKVIAFLASRGVPLAAENDRGETPLVLSEKQERLRLMQERVRFIGRQGSQEGDSAAVLHTETSDAIKHALKDATATPAASIKSSG